MIKRNFIKGNHISMKYSFSKTIHIYSWILFVFMEYSETFSVFKNLQKPKKLFCPSKNLIMRITSRLANIYLYILYSDM